MKKRILAALILALSLSFTLCACGDDDKSSKKKSSKKAEAVEEDEDEDEDEDEVTPKSLNTVEEAEEADFEEAEYDSSAIEDIIYSDEMQSSLVEANKQLEASNIRCDMSAEGDDRLVVTYTFLSQVNLGGASKSAIEEKLDEQLIPVLKDSAVSMTLPFSQKGVDINSIRIIVLNADYSEIYNKVFDI